MAGVVLGVDRVRATQRFFLEAQNPKPATWIEILAEGRGFEPLRACTLTVFKTVAIDRSAIPPLSILLKDRCSATALGLSKVR